MNEGWRLPSGWWCGPGGLTHADALASPTLFCAQAESIGILATPDSLEARFQRLEGSGGVEDDLAALKKGLLTPVAESGMGEVAVASRPLYDEVVARRPQAVSEIDAELEQLRKRARM